MKPLILLGVLAWAGGALAEDFKLSASPAFVGYSAAYGVTPLAVGMANQGANARGVLRVTAGEYQMDYPVELPRGAKKQVLVYPTTSFGEDIGLELRTDRGTERALYRQTIQPEAAGQQVLLIGDDQGGLAFLRSTRREDAARLADCYAAPELAPDRPLAYGSLAAVVLGSGAERLSDSAVKALHTYIISGGTVAFLGGAASPTLADRRWWDVIPVRAQLPVTIERSPMMSNFADETTGPFTILRAQPLGNATRIEGGEVMVASRPVGLGKTIFFAFNPLEAPLTRWPGRRALMVKFLRPMDTQRSMGFLRSFQGASPYDPYGYGYGSGPAYTTYAPPPAGMAATTGGPPPMTVAPATYFPQQDPFSTELPRPEKVFWILASYFVVIVPINFLLLRKLKRGELAWVTAPVISVAFAGAFFAAASDLYSAKLSQATQGLIVASEGRPEALFVGRTQMFFPRGGEYDLKMEGLDSVGAIDPSEVYYSSFGRRRDTTRMADVQPVDTGEVRVSRMSVSNLAFRELSYTQSLPPSRWLKVDLDRATRTLKITNIGRYNLARLTPIVAGHSFDSASLAPGQTRTLKLPARIEPNYERNTPNYAPGYPAAFQIGLPLSGIAEHTDRTKGIVIKANVPEMPVGPGIGKVVGERQSVVLLYFTDLQYGKVTL